MRTGVSGLRPHPYAPLPSTWCVMSELAVSGKSKTAMSDRAPAPGIAAELPDASDPKPGIMIEFRGLSADDASMAQQLWQLLNQGAQKLAAVAQDGCSIAVKESMAYAVHVMEAAQSNMNSAIELASALTTAKGPSDVID